MSRRGNAGEADERGLALIVALLVTLVAVGLCGVAAADALHGNSTNSVGTKMVQASGAAESGIDLTIAGIQSGWGLPNCGSQTPQGLGAPTYESFTVTIKYFDASGISLCPQNGAAPTKAPSSALIESVGTNDSAGVFGDATWEALIKLTASPSAASGFDRAIYANAALGITNKAAVYGDGAGNDADIYVSGDFSCTNNAYNYGSLYVQGDIDATNQCGSAGNWWAGGSICDSGKGTVSGKAYAAGVTSGACNASPGTISIGSAVVAKGAVARAGITPWPCPNSQIQGSCTAFTGSATNPGPPPADPFPLWSLNTTTWQSAGYTVVNDTTGTTNPGTPCSTSAQVYTDLKNMSSGGSSPTLIYTDCQISWNVNVCPKVGNTCTWTFANNLAIVDTGGYTATGSVSFQSTSSTPHSFFMMVPYDKYGSSTVNTCGSGNGIGTVNFTNAISTGGSGNSNPLGIMVYSPCGMSFTNSVSLTGQVYAGGNLSITNSYTMHFQLVPVPGYSTSGSASPTATSYTVALLYKRQNQSG